MIGQMRAWQLEAAGSGRLNLVERPVPRPGPGEVLVRVGAVSLNYRDKLVREGRMAADKAMPFTPGSDMAGVVAAAGAGVSRLRVGDHVISHF